MSLFHTRPPPYFSASRSNAIKSLAMVKKHGAGKRTIGMSRPAENGVTGPGWV
jgi:hypothetical protein